MRTTVDHEPGDQLAREPHDPDHHSDLEPVATVQAKPGTVLRVAFYGRVVVYDGERDADADADLADLADQYEQCRRALPSGAITAIFYDIDTSRPQHRRPMPGQLPLSKGNRRRDSGLPDLVNEAASPHRRFAYLIATGPDQLSRHTRHLVALRRTLHATGVGCLFPTGAGAAGPDALGLLTLIDGEAWLRARAQCEQGPRR